MYCSSCGAALPSGLSYCNRCGAGLTVKQEKAPSKSDLPESLVWAVVSVSVGGMAMLIGLMAMMKETLNFSNQLITLFAFLGFLLLLGAESVFVWLLVRRGKALSSQEQGHPTQLPGAVTRELAEGRTPIEPAMSVTEHTTATLVEPIYRERKT